MVATKMSWILVVLFCALLGGTGQVFFKLGSKTLEFNAAALLTNWKLIIGLVLYGVATVLFTVALKHGDLSLLYPVIATSYIWVALFSILFLHETFPAYKWGGMALLLLGVIVIVV
jgi:drug/metabolite transporter (DMT)-like permease